jgi:hypothetical protein
MKRVARGALAGLLATVPMSLWMLLARALGLLVVPPPAQITANVEEKTGARDDLPRQGFGARWVLSHFAYGALLGAVYAFARPALPRRTAVAGLLYGATMWAGNYLGLMPALGLYPWPSEDSRSRTLVMVIAHLLFGSAASAADRLLNWRQGPLLARTRLGEIRQRL